MIVSVVGTRPQFIKAAILARVLKMDIVDTGQHYDYSMAGQFFSEFQLYPKTIATAGDVTSMYQKLLDILPRYETVIVYGDCNTTLSAALASRHLGKRLVHVEAGCRSYNRAMIEESIRLTVDHLANLNLCPTKSALDNLRHEGVSGMFTGDLSQDYINSRVSKPKNGLPVATIHRAENMEHEREIVEIFANLKTNILWPQHPKMKSWKLPKNVLPIDPVDYATMLDMVEAAPYVITDSGGLQKEAYMLKTKCVTLRKDTEWIETLAGGWNTLVGVDVEKAVKAINIKPGTWTAGVFGEHAAERIKNAVERLDTTGGQRDLIEMRKTGGGTSFGWN